MLPAVHMSPFKRAADAVPHLRGLECHCVQCQCFELVRTRHERYNNAQPVCAAPTEILSYIMTLVVDARVSVVWPESSKKGVLVASVILAQVCRRFRTVAIGTTYLWTTITMHHHMPGVPRFQTDELWLRRSRNALLDICIDWRTYDVKWDGKEESHWLNELDVQFAMHLVCHHAARWKTFQMVSDGYRPLALALPWLSRVEVPRLEMMELMRHAPYLGPLWDFHPPEYAAPVALFTKGAPRLARVALCGVHIDWKSVPFVNLDLFELQCHPGSTMPSIDEYRVILAASPTLRSLSALASGPVMHLTEGQDTDPVELPTVREMLLGYISREYAEDFIDVFHTPGVTHLMLRDMSGLREGTDLGPLLRRVAAEGRFARVTQLTLGHVVAPTGDLAALAGAAFPRVATLHLHFMGRGVVDALARAPGVWPALKVVKWKGEHNDVAPLHRLVRARADGGVPLEEVWVGVDGAMPEGEEYVRLDDYKAPPREDDEDGARGLRPRRELTDNEIRHIWELYHRVVAQGPVPP